MTDKPDADVETHRQDDGEGVVVLTRTRWDILFLGLALPALGVAVFFYLATEEISFLISPLAIIPLWLDARFATPPCGMKVRRITATPGCRQLLAWLALMVLLISGVTAFDVFVIGHGFHEPSKPYHVALYLPLLIMLLVGLWVIEKRYCKAKLPDTESGAQAKEYGERGSIP